MVHALILSKAVLYETKAFAVLLCSPTIKILDKSLIWRDFPVHEENLYFQFPNHFAETKEEIAWEGKKFCCSKILQANKTDVYVVGGR